MMTLQHTSGELSTGSLRVVHSSRVNSSSTVSDRKKLPILTEMHDRGISPDTHRTYLLSETLCCSQ